MVRTYSNNKKVYSVDMMFAYINIFKPSYKKINIDDLIYALDSKGWYDSKSKNNISAQDVIDNPKKYKAEFETIHNSNLKYPIITYNNTIIDGIHRLAKSYLLNKKYIKAYNFDSNLMKKFLIRRDGDWRAVSRLETSLFIKLFWKRFLPEIK